jgi:hypothetical protein
MHFLNRKNINDINELQGLSGKIDLFKLNFIKLFLTV